MAHHANDRIDLFLIPRTVLACPQFDAQQLGPLHALPYRYSFHNMPLYRILEELKEQKTD
jgi:hypothetical protein